MGRLFLPGHVFVRRKWLFWAAGESTAIASQSAMLGEFLAIAQVDAKLADAVMNFARKWGAMEICLHGKPITHNSREDDEEYYKRPRRWRSCNPVMVGSVCTECGVPLGRGPREEVCRKHGIRRVPLYREPIRLWKQWSRMFGAFLRIAKSLADETPGEPDDWQIVNECPWWRDIPTNRASTGRPKLDGDWQALAERLDRCIEIGDVRPRSVWRNGSTPDLIFGCGLTLDRIGLFGCLSLYVQTEISGAKRLETCSSCRRWYVPTRAPVAGRRHYCQACRAEGIPEKNARRDHKRRAHVEQN